MTARAVFAQLAGSWDLDRRLDPAIGTMLGTATFTPDGPERLAYREEGELRLTEGFSGRATREYRWVLVDDDRIDVLFAEDRWSGGLMHSLRFAGDAVASDVHHCGADDYTGTYAFTPPDLVVITMDVRGPAKDYRTVTTLRRHPHPHSARTARTPSSRAQSSSARRPARWSS